MTYAPEPHAPEHNIDDVAEEQAIQDIADRLLEDDTCSTINANYDFEAVEIEAGFEHISLIDAAFNVAKKIYKAVYKYEQQGE